MDSLLAEIARKRKNVEKAKASSKVRKITASSSSTTGKGGDDKGVKRYIRAADLRRFEAEEAFRLEEEAHAKKSKASKSKRRTKKDEEEEDVETTTTTTTTTATTTIKDKSDVSVESTRKNDASSSSTVAAAVDVVVVARPSAEIDAALRALGLPVRFFGENDDDGAREKRLREAETARDAKEEDDNDMDEFRLGSGHGIRNPFLGGRRNADGEDDEEAIAARRDAAGGGGERGDDDRQRRKRRRRDDDDEKADDVDDPADKHKRVYRYFKSLLRRWEDDHAARPDDVRRSAQGRFDSKTLKQCRDYVRPLFRLLKSRRLEPFLLDKIHEIVEHCAAGEFVKAHDVYNDVAIGRAAWPIGVTMVGIHARSGRAKIESGNVAHVMNSELQRKYLTSVKRLMTYNQSKRDDVAPSKKVVN